MMSRRGYAHKGLMRCCMLTLDIAHEVGIFHDAESMKCMYCDKNMVLDEQRAMFRCEHEFRESMPNFSSNEGDEPPDDWGQYGT